jgi:DNA topoisomerase-3
MVAAGTGKRAPGKRYVDDSKVSDHHAILPNAVNPGKASLSPQERKVYDLVCRRFLMMWHDDHLQDVTTVITAITNPGEGNSGSTIDRYRTSGTLVRQLGWKALDVAPEKSKKSGKGGGEDEEAEQVLPPDLAQGQAQRVASVEAKKKKTKPPKRFTEGTLLTAMQTAGQSLDEKELSEAMRDTGLGTPATRAGIIEVLLKRGYIARKGKTLEATEKGIHLIEVVHPEVKTPAMTGQWEACLKKINQGEAQLPPFIEGIEDYVRGVVDKVRVTPRRAFAPVPKAAQAAQPAPVEKPAKRASNTARLSGVLEERFGLKKFPSGLKGACIAVLSGKDYLLASSAADRALCYHVAGLALQGTALVAAARPDWIEEQIRKLRGRGVAADCIHAGRDRESLRAVCVDYLNGRLQFLYIVPERLAVPGFPEMLAKRKPVLIAIEEAQLTIGANQSHLSGYGLLPKSLALLRPAPVLALTSEASPEIEKEISRVLGLRV